MTLPDAIDALRRFLIRRKIRRWSVMHAKYLLTLRAEAELRESAWRDYRTIEGFVIQKVEVREL